jgi:anaerobic selenocysteine-containing dehydrogenase
VEHLESPNEEYPLYATSRKLPIYVHTKFRNLESLSRLQNEPLVRIHPNDAKTFSISEGEYIKIVNPRGEITLKATISDITREGLIVIDFGWGNPWDGKANVNLLVNDSIWDPVSGGTPNRLFVCNIKSI